VRLQKVIPNISAINPVTRYFLILQLFRLANNLSIPRFSWKIQLQYSLPL